MMWTLSLDRGGSPKFGFEVVVESNDYRQDLDDTAAIRQ